MANSLSGPVCVTGASGFLGLHCVKQLLQRGYVVHATVRDPSNTSKTKVLNEIAMELSCSEKLKVFGADLNKEASFDDAIKDCLCVFHTASPFFGPGPEYTKDNFLIPAVEGTLNVFRSAKKAGTVKRVVLTSSTAAVYTVFGKKPPEHIFTEKDWSSIEGMEEQGHWYSLSKTRAEQVAKEFVAAEDCPFDLSVMLPTLIWGPMLNETLNTSSAVVASYVNGEKNEIEPTHKTVVDVRDVAFAHIAAWEAFPKATGRYLLISDCFSLKEMCQFMAKEFPKFEANIPTDVSETIPPSSSGAPTPFETKFDSSRAVGLMGKDFISWKEQVKETVKSLIKHDLV